jgi:hypothetical protein
MTGFFLPLSVQKQRERPFLQTAAPKNRMIAAFAGRNLHLLVKEPVSS